MKIRQGFVSNSSTSSYVCDISGEEHAGMDISMRECGMAMCERGHTFMEEYCDMDAINAYCLEKAKEEMPQDSEYDEEDWAADIMSDMRYGDIPSEFCPICTLKYPLTYMKLKYLLQLVGLSDTEITDEIKRRFGETPELFWDFINPKEPTCEKSTL